MGRQPEFESKSYECIHSSLIKHSRARKTQHTRARTHGRENRKQGRPGKGKAGLALPTDIATQYHRAWAVMSARLLIVLRGELNHKTRSRMTGMPPHSATWLVEEADYRLIVRKLGEHVMKPIIRIGSW